MGKSKVVKGNWPLTKIAYLAGIIDGDGCIYAGPRTQANASNGKYYLHTLIQVTSTDKILIDWLDENFGGTVNQYTPKQRAINCKGAVHSWKLTGNTIQHLCELMMPYLVIKKDQARIMIELRKTYFCSQYIKGKAGVQAVSDEIKQKRKILVEELQKLHIRNHTFHKD